MYGAFKTQKERQRKNYEIIRVKVNHTLDIKNNLQVSLQGFCKIKQSRSFPELPGENVLGFEPKLCFHTVSKLISKPPEGHSFPTELSHQGNNVRPVRKLVGREKLRPSLSHTLFPHNTDEKLITAIQASQFSATFI